MKKLLVFLLGFSLFVLTSCKKNTSAILNGVYTESSPVAGRSQLNFITNNLVIKSETGSIYKDIFNYSFSSNKIILALTTNQYPAQEFDFKEIDDKSFQIANLYPSIPEAPPTYMIYKK